MATYPVGTVVVQDDAVWTQVPMFGWYRFHRSTVSAEWATSPLGLSGIRLDDGDLSARILVAESRFPRLVAALGAYGWTDVSGGDTSRA